MAGMDIGLSPLLFCLGHFSQTKYQKRLLVKVIFLYICTESLVSIQNTNINFRVKLNFVRFV